MSITKIRIEEALEIHQKETGKKLSKIGLSRLIQSDVSPTTVQNYIQRAIVGDKELPLYILSQIALICGVTTDYLLGLTETHTGIKQMAERALKHATDAKEENEGIVSALTKK